MNVYLIRHTSVNVPPCTCYGQTDVPLRDTFEAEAAETYSRIKEINFDKAYTSPLTRCVKLATFCGYPSAERDDRLKEINFGDWEMQNYETLNDPRLQEWFNDYIHVRATNGESFMDQYQRVSNFLDTLRLQSYKNVVIFTHGGVLVNAQIYAGLFPFTEAFEHQSPYGAVVKIEL